MKIRTKESLMLLALCLVALIAFSLKQDVVRTLLIDLEKVDVEISKPIQVSSDITITLPTDINTPIIETQSKHDVKVITEARVESKDDWGDLIDEMQKRKVTGNGDSLQLEERTLHMLIKLEQEWGEQLEIKWAKRDKALNTEIGGRSHSQHLKGKAVDIMHNGWSQAKMRKFIRLAYDTGFRGFGTGKTMIHIDSRDKLGAWLYPGSPYPSARKILRDKVN